MGLKAAVSQLDTDNTKLSADQATVVSDQQKLLADQGTVTTDQTTVGTDDQAIVAALQAGPNPAFIGPAADGSIAVYTLDSTQPAGFSVVQVQPAN